MTVWQPGLRHQLSIVHYAWLFSTAVFYLQERGCFVFAFAGPQEVRELELGTDMASVNNLLGFLEKARALPAQPRWRAEGHLCCSIKLTVVLGKGCL